MRSSALLFAGTASATYTGWTNAPTYITPANNNNQCTSQEQTGFDWTGLNTGSFSSYDSYSFSGFQCTSTFGKRDTLTKRTFGGKTIQGTMGAGSGPSISCGASKDFSITEYQVSVSRDTDVEFHYQMDDGSTCKHTTSCKSGGTIVQNSQCGGAKQVQFQLPQGSSSGCDIGIHSIGFDCSPPASSVPPPKASSSSTPTYSKPSSTPVVPTTSSTPAVPSSSTPAVPSSSKLVPNVPSSSIPVPCSYGASGPGCSAPAPSTSSIPVSCYNGGSGPDCSVPVRSTSSTPVGPVSSTSSIPLPCSYGGSGAGCSVPVPAISSTPMSCSNGGSGPDCSVPITSASSMPVPCSYGSGSSGGAGCAPIPSVSSTPVVPVTTSSPSVPVPNVPSSSIPIPAISCSYGSSGSSCLPSPSAPAVPSSSIPIPAISCSYGSSGSSCLPSPSTPAVPATTTSSVPVPESPSPSVPVPNVPASSSTPVSPVTSSLPVPTSSSIPVPKPSSTKPSPPVTTAPCPDVVPQCLNTWIGQTGCKDNSDHECFCPKADFTKNVIDCITAHGADDAEVQKALTYLIGICAAHIPQNPGLITNCPSSIPLTAAGTPPASTPASTPNSPVKSTVTPAVGSTTTKVVYTTFSSCSIGQTITAAGTTIVLQSPSISTITMTSTRTIPCSKCAASPSASTPASPITINSPTAIPMTTITIAQIYTVPCTYSTGPSAGFPIPSSSRVTLLSTAVTVPQVAFTTIAPVGAATAAAVGLAPATSAVTVVPVYGTTATGILTAPSAATNTGFGTTYVPSKSTTGGPLMVTTNAGVRVGGSIAGLFAGAVVAAMAL